MKDRLVILVARIIGEKKENHTIALNGWNNCRGASLVIIVVVVLDML